MVSKISAAYIKNNKEHAKTTAYYLVSIQNRILNINTTKHKDLQVVSINNLDDLTNINILKLREFCTFLIDSKIISHRDLDSILKNFIVYQTELAQLTKLEIAKLYSTSKEEIIEDQDKLFSELLDKIPNDEKIH